MASAPNTKGKDKPTKTLGAIHEIPLNEIESIATSQPGRSSRSTIYDNPIRDLPDGVARFMEESETVSTQAIGLGLHAAAKRAKSLNRSDPSPLTTRNGNKDGRKGIIYYWTPATQAE